MQQNRNTYTILVDTKKTYLLMKVWLVQKVVDPATDDTVNSFKLSKDSLICLFLNNQVVVVMTR